MRNLNTTYLNDEILSFDLILSKETELNSRGVTIENIDSGIFSLSKGSSVIYGYYGCMLADVEFYIAPPTNCEPVVDVIENIFDVELSFEESVLEN